MVRVGAVLVAALACLVHSLGYVQRTTFTYCRHCGTDREEHERRFGPVVLARSSETKPSEAFRDLLDSSHAHEWTFASTTFTSAMGEGIG